MSTTIDNLRVDHRVTVLREFTDAIGTRMAVGESGCIRVLSFDQVHMKIHMEIENERKRVALVFPLTAQHGPRNGHMQEFFQLGDYVPIPGSEPTPQVPETRIMRAPQPEAHNAQETGLAWWRAARSVEGPDWLEDVEKEMLRDAQHIGMAASIAEMYAQRMRAFQQEGNEPRAVAAFKLAVQWMATYAGWATSGGEGAALSWERDQFHAALVKELGYDPTNG